MKVTAARIRFLRAVDVCSGPLPDDGATDWGEVHAHYDDLPAGHRAAPLAMLNFDRVADACVNAGLVVKNETTGKISLTPAGRTILDAAPRRTR